MTYEFIQRTIESRKLRSLDELLPYLPAEYRSHYVLMLKSRSLQEASPDNPRVIMHGTDARTTIAFNGDPTQAGYNRLEVMQFNDQTKAFEVHEIEFPSDPIDKKSFVHFSAANPQKCVDCHRQDVRPNWEPYPRWPGAYGGLEERVAGLPNAFSGRSGEEELRKLKQGADLKVSSDGSRMTQVGEEDGLPRFLKRAANHPRYKYLEGLQQRYALSPDGPNDQLPSRPNVDYSYSVADLNFQRVVRILRSSPNYERFKYAYVTAAYCRKPLTDYVPAEFVPDHLRGKFYDVGFSPVIYFIAALSGLKNVTDLSMTFVGDPNDDDALSSPKSGYVDLGDALTAADPSLTAKYAKLGAQTDEERAPKCAELKRLSLAALKDFALPQAVVPPEQFTPPRAPHASESEEGSHLAAPLPALEQSCQMCHSTEDSDLFIPFNNPKALKAALGREARKSGTRENLKEAILRRIAAHASVAVRMPYMKEPLSPKEIQTIESYLDSLVPKAQKAVNSPVDVPNRNSATDAPHSP